MSDYKAKVIADSIAVWEGNIGPRLTTLEICFPRYLLSEFNTHRVLSRNSASSRAIPIHKQIQKVIDHPVIPMFTKNQAGMQGELLDPESFEFEQAKRAWDNAKHRAICSAQRLADIGIHKQNANRLLEPFMWHTVIVTATDWANFFFLRCNPAAQPEMRHIAFLMWNAYSKSTPVDKNEGNWHLPYITEQEKEQLEPEEQVRISTARCARVSVLGHDGIRDYSKDIDLHDKLVTNSHWSPLEHPAQVNPAQYNGSNFAMPWHQYRKRFSNECIDVYPIH